MERPKCKDYKKSLKSLDNHSMDLIEWSWWAEDRIKKLEEELKIFR